MQNKHNKISWYWYSNYYFSMILAKSHLRKFALYEVDGIEIEDENKIYIIYNDAPVSGGGLYCCSFLDLWHKSKVSKYFQQQIPNATITKPIPNPMKKPTAFLAWSPVYLFIYCIIYILYNPL